MNRQSPTSLLLATDRLASPLLEAGAASPTARAAYTPYGYRPGGQQGLQSRIGFTGQLREPQIGWYMLGNGHRAYNPILMRFHSPDALSPFDKGGLNSYAYCLGDPINTQDPSGNFPAPLVTIMGNIPNYLSAPMLIAQYQRGEPISVGGLAVTGLSVMAGLLSVKGAYDQYHDPSNSFNADLSTVVGGLVGGIAMLG